VKTSKWLGASFVFIVEVVLRSDLNASTRTSKLANGLGLPQFSPLRSNLNAVHADLKPCERPRASIIFIVEV
jgi:hypothetical protein